MAALGSAGIKAILLDIGGVVLTKGWGHESRKEATERFGLDRSEMEERHQAVLPIYEQGLIALDQYLNWVVFYQERNFSPELFKEFMYGQSRPYPDALDFFKHVKAQNALRVVALSNEGRELALYRIREFRLASLYDFFVSSCFVGSRKPDPAIYQVTMDLVQLTPEQVVYIDDTPLLAEAGRDAGIPSIHHTDIASTREKLAELGLQVAG